MTLTAEEEQTISGRIVGVTMRLMELGAMLVEKCAAVPWIAKYKEWDSLGIVADESSASDVNR